MFRLTSIEMPSWVPGMKDGRPVAVELTLPVRFQMNEGEEIDKKTKVYKERSTTVEILKVFPNPATSAVTIEFKAEPGNYTIAMTDADGRDIFSKKISDYDGQTIKLNSIAVEDEIKGTKYVTVFDDRGNALKNTTVILQ